jgi:hypothetical protein
MRSDKSWEVKKEILIKTQEMLESCVTYIFLIFYKVYHNASDISQGLQFDFAEALVRLR